jgi:hypothetical protein
MAICSVLVAPHGAVAQGWLPPAAAPELSSPAQLVPMPPPEADVSRYRVLAIAGGAVIGVIAANVITGGIITPILAVGTGALPAAAAAPAVGAPTLVAASIAADMVMMTAAPTAVLGATTTQVVTRIGDGYESARTAVTDLGAAIGNWLDGT